MRKEFFLFILAILLISVVSAVEIQIKDRVNLGETVKFPILALALIG